MKKPFNIISIIIIILCFSQNLLAVTNYVSKTGAHIYPFDSWANAATNIQDAVSIARDGDLVLVNDGTYYIEWSINVQFDMIVKSLNGDEKTIVDGGFPARTNGCFYLKNGTIDGFTITKGYKHSTSYGGGGVSSQYGGKTKNCTIIGNYALKDGGGVYLNQGGTLDNCTVIGNYASDGGGGVYCKSSTIQDCTITGNYANVQGGGVYDYGSMLQNCTISENSATNGGGMVCYYGSRIQDCLITENSATNGGGIVCYFGSTIQNCIISGNTANGQGGGVDCVAGTVQNCTIIGNAAKGQGGGVVCNSGTIQDSILWNNTNGNLFVSGSANLYNCIEEWTNLVNGVITNNPMFVDADAANYRLELGSACIDAGTNLPWMVGAKDLDGNPRIVDGTVDMGAYEFVPEPETNYVSKTGAHISPFTSWANAATNIQAAIDAASLGDTVFVNDGAYYPGSQISITKGIIVKSVNGAEKTIVNGGFPAQTNSCFYLEMGTIEGFTITNGYTLSSGGGVYLYLGGTVQNCTIIGNSSAGGVAGVYCRAGTIRNCAIIGNVSDYGTGGVYCRSGTIQSCTIVGNSSGDSYGGVQCSGSIVQNSILWNNISGNSFANGSTNSYNCIERWATLVNGIITNDPMFVDADAANYRLKFGSACINAGTNLLWMVGATDLDGNPRIYDGTVDMGAYEFIPEPCLFIIYNLLIFIYYFRRLIIDN